MSNFFIAVSIVLSGLITGLLYGYDCSVIKGLGKLSDKEYLTAFQQINREIQNPYFFTSFMGTFIILPIVAWIFYKENGIYSYWLLAATFFYWIGVFGITVVANVPLNNWLDSLQIDNFSIEALHAIRQKFETNWNKWHHLRTYAAIVSFSCSILSLIKLK